MSSKNTYDIGLVIPLKEEFQYVAELAPVRGRHPYDGTLFYEMDFGRATAIACVVGEMGPLPASHATNRLLSFADVKLVAVLGVAGSLDKDVLLGDIVIADEVNEFLAKSKAVEAADGYEFKFSGRHSRIDYSVREAVHHFDLSGGESLAAWRSVSNADYDALTADADRTLCKPLPTLHLGSIASGDVVGAAKAFTEQLLLIDRKFLALDMEAAGVVKAASDRLSPVRVIVIRGISDFADGRKKTLDSQGHGAWRRLGVRRASSLLTSLLGWETFRTCIGLTGDGCSQDELDPAVLITSLQGQAGGAWLVGVLFGLQVLAPVLSDRGEVIPKDIGEARLTDVSLDAAVCAIEGIRSSIAAGHISARAVVERIAEIADVFRRSLTLEQADMLKQFDSVIVTICQPTGVEDGELAETVSNISQMLDEGRLDEAAQLLSNLDARKGPVRELLADLYFSRNQHAEVCRLLAAWDPEAISRRELEHFIASSFEALEQDTARRLLHLHSRQYPDAAAKLFRNHIGTKYPDGISNA